MVCVGTVWEEAQLRHGVDVTIIPVRAYTDATNLTHMASSRAKAHVGNENLFAKVLIIDRILRHSERASARAINRRSVIRAVSLEMTLF